MLGVNDVLNWSLRLGRVFGTEVRVSWLLAVWMLFDAVNFSRAHRVDLIGFAFVIPPLAMILHAVGHGVAARMGGGNLDQTILSVINNQDQFRLPLRPWSHFLAGIGGLTINLAVAGGCFLGSSFTSSDLLGELLGYAFKTNLLIGLVNLFACQPLDGHRWWRGLLWRFFSMRQAVDAAIVLGFASAILLLMYAVWTTDFLLLFIGICSLLAMINDRMSVSQGQDPVFLVDPRYGGSAPPSNWAKQRAARAEQKAEAETTAEQEVLDRLLAKVSEHGLPSLTNGERKQLQQISKRQKERGA